MKKYTVKIYDEDHERVAEFNLDTTEQVANLIKLFEEHAKNDHSYNITPEGVREWA